MQEHPGCDSDSERERMWCKHRETIESWGILSCVGWESEATLLLWREGTKWWLWGCLYGLGKFAKLILAASSSLFLHPLPNFGFCCLPPHKEESSQADGHHGPPCSSSTTTSCSSWPLCLLAGLPAFSLSGATLPCAMGWIVPPSPTFVCSSPTTQHPRMWLYLELRPLKRS